MSKTFSEIASLWKAEKRRWVKESTYATYVQHLNCRLLPAFGGLCRITEEDVQNYVNTAQDHGVSEKTVRDSLMLLKMVQKYGARHGLWQMGEYEVHFLPSSPNPEIAGPILSARDSLRLQEYLLDNISFRNLGLLICINSGLRIGEICALQWRDINMETGSLTVKKTVQRIWFSDEGEHHCSVVIGTPKSSSSFREVPLAKAIIRFLRPLKKYVKDDNYVVSNGPAPMEPRNYRNYFYKILSAEGLPKVHFHALRHGFATRCIESGCDYKTLSSLLGHSSISTTLDMYVHPDINAKRRCIEKMAGVWRR